MISSKFAKALLTRYEPSLIKAHNSLKTSLLDETQETSVFTILKALKNIAASVDCDASQTAFRVQIDNIGFQGFCYCDENPELKAFYKAAHGKLHHPYGPHVNGVKAGYGGFFKEALPDIAFSPFRATFLACSDGGKNFIKGCIFTAIFAIPLIVPTIITMLCAAVLAVLSGLTYPVALAGAALADLCNTDNEDQGSFVHP